MKDITAWLVAHNGLQVTNNSLLKCWKTLPTKHNFEMPNIIMVKLRNKDVRELQHLLEKHSNLSQIRKNHIESKKEYGYDVWKTGAKLDGFIMPLMENTEERIYLIIVSEKEDGTLTLDECINHELTHALEMEINYHLKKGDKEIFYNENPLVPDQEFRIIKPQ